MSNPKAFISYSWSNPLHEQWVIDLAEQLTDSGVHVILDKWDLKEGHDANAFMEKMVTDPDVKKVIMVSDKAYAEKADGRAGGVGTETQIISQEVYANQEQDKFALVVSEKDSNGKAFLPTYYKSRIYIDLSEPDTYAENFEKLIRWVYDKPLYRRPEMGKPPSFLDEDDGPTLGTSVTFKRALTAIKESKPHASGALNEFFETFAANMERFRLQRSEGEWDDEVVESIEKFAPYRNEAIHIFNAIAQYSTTTETLNSLHRFLESLIPYMHPPEGIGSFRGWDFDNFRFIVNELFLYAIATLIKHERFNETAMLLNTQYFVENGMVSFTAFREPIESLRHRNDRLQLNRLSVQADLLEKRSRASGLEFRYLMQADFVLFIRGDLLTDSQYDRWWPNTLVYVNSFRGSFEIFARASSKKYFDKVKVLLGITNFDELTKLILEYQSGQRRVPSWSCESFDPITLIGFDNLAQRP